MKIKKSIIGLSSIGLLATITPASPIATNQLTFVDSQNVQSLEVGNKLAEIKSINKSCEKLVSYKSWCDEKFTPRYWITNIESRVKIEDGSEAGVKEGKIEREDLFTYTRTDKQYESYFRYISNNVKENNHTSWGNAKKYQLNITVPANTKEFKVQVVANVKIKNCLNGALTSDQWVDSYGFAQAKLSQLSTHPQEILLPYIGIKDDSIYLYDSEKFNIKTQNDLFRLFVNYGLWENKPYEKATLSSFITLSNETPEPIEIPIYFWYGFFGGGYRGKENGSHINCSEVTFTANHIEY